MQEAAKAAISSQEHRSLHRSCGGGGYTLGAAQTDKRIKAVATLSMFNTGRVRRNGFRDSQLDTIQERLKQAAQARVDEILSAKAD